MQQTPEELKQIVQEFASSAEWVDCVRLRADRRWYRRLHYGPDYDVWLIAWMPGQSTGFHDHGASAGAFVVTTGSLEEHRPGESKRSVPKGQFRVFGPDYAHDVRNVSTAPAISIHAYSPPLSRMNEYDLEGERLIPRASEPRDRDRGDEPARIQAQVARSRNGVPTIEETLAAARARLRRLSAREAYEAFATKKVVLVDIRPERQRAFEGRIDGALIVERNVLEWRFDPASDSRLPIATSHDVPVIVFCSEGYTSSLAAAALQDLGLWRATDMKGGFKAWRDQGLPLSMESTG